DVLRAERGVATEEHARPRRHHGLRIDLGHAPLVEFEADVAFDPREGVFLTDRDQNVVAWHVLVGLAGRHELAATLGVALGLDLLEGDAGEAAAVVGESLWHQIIEDRDVLMHRVLLLPRRRLHLLEAGAHDHFDVLAAEPARGAAAIHRRVAAAEHDHALADLADVAERDAGEPVDADVDVLRRLATPGDVEVAPARRAGTYEHRIVVLGEQRLEAADTLAADELDAEVENVTTLLVDDGFGQAELRDLGADHSAGLRVGVEHHAMVAERRKVARNRKRGRPAAD